jgi:hypothetical protein
MELHQPDAKQAQRQLRDHPGTIQTSRLVGETWKPFGLNIRDLLIGITKWQNSVDFAFSADKVFSVSYPLGQDKTELRFALPGNIKSLRLPVDASQLATLVFARGQGTALTSN